MYLHLRDGCCRAVQGPQSEQGGHTGAGGAGRAGRELQVRRVKLLVESALGPGGLVGEVMLSTT